MSETLFDDAGAQAAADEGMAKALRAERVEAWKGNAESWLEGVERYATFTADDLVAVIGLPDQGVARNNVVGAWLAAKSRKGVIRWTGRFKKSERVIGHGNLQRVWERQ